MMSGKNTVNYVDGLKTRNDNIPAAIIDNCRLYNNTSKQNKKSGNIIIKHASAKYALARNRFRLVLVSFQSRIPIVATYHWIKP
jgi:hypothetical protein